MRYRLHLSDAVSEIRELADGREYSCPRGHWHFERELRLPFRPRPGLALVTDRDEAGEPIYFLLQRLVWDCTRAAWLGYGKLHILVPHESTKETLAKHYPNWSVRWIDDHRFDAETGALLPEPSDGN